MAAPPMRRQRGNVVQTLPRQHRRAGGRHTYNVGKHSIIPRQVALAMLFPHEIRRHQNPALLPVDFATLTLATACFRAREIYGLVFLGRTLSLPILTTFRGQGTV
jgi:hypothetical protein